MILNDMIVQAHLDGLAWFPKDARDLEAHILYTVGELGELIGLVKKCDREQLDFTDAAVRLNMAEELADAFEHLLNCAAIMNVDLEKVRELKRGKNIERWGQPDHAAAIQTLNGKDSKAGG